MIDTDAAEPSVVTDGGGRFAIAYVADGCVACIRIEHAAYLPLEAERRVAGGDTDLGPLTLRRGGRLVGRVVGRWPQRREGIRVRAGLELGYAPNTQTAAAVAVVAVAAAAAAAKAILMARFAHKVYPLSVQVLSGRRERGYGSDCLRSRCGQPVMKSH